MSHQLEIVKSYLKNQPNIPTEKLKLRCFDDDLDLKKSESAENLESTIIIKGSIEPTHGSICSDVSKFQSMDVLKLLGTKAD